MKKGLLLVFTLLILCNIVKSQYSTWVAPSNYMAATIAGASFVSANNGWVVGTAGSIYTTTNGGTKWSPQTSGTTNALSAVHFVNTTNGWAVGANGTILATTNGGTTWISQTSGVSVTLTGVHFVSTTVGWVIGSSGNILATTNGGATWTPQVSGVSIALSSVYFTSTTQGWVVGAGGNILATTNGGTTWTAQVTGTVNALSGVYFVNATQGWAVGALGTILSTSNGGTSWTKQTSGSTNTLSSVHFLNANRGWTVGANGTILTTANGGTSWSIITSGTTNALSFVYFSSATKGFVGGSNVVLSTINSGSNWTTSLSGTTSILRAVSFINSTTCWAVGSGPTVLASVNGGETWDKQTIQTIRQLYGVSFVNANQGWAVDVGGEILTTINGGTTWTQQTSPTINSLASVYFITPTLGWAVGTNGTIISTTDGGTTWTQQTSPTSNSLSSVYFASTTQGMAVGAGGTILSTNNGGATWTQQTSPTTNALSSLSMVSANKGWAVGSIGTILTTNNGGATWTKQNSSTTNQLLSVHFVNANQGWAVGTTGTILSTTDGGATWVVQSSGTTQPLYGVSFNDATLQGCAVGNAGTILLYNANDTAIKTPVVNSFSPVSAVTGATITIKGSAFTGTTNVSFGDTSAASFTVLNDSTISAVLGNGTSGFVIVSNSAGSDSMAGFTYKGTGKTYLWTRPSNYVNCTLTNTNFVNGTQAWAVGSNGTILATNDGGTTWVSQASGKTTTLNSTYFYSATQGCAVGVSGVILTTTDGGNSWISRNSGIGISLSSVFFVSPTKGWVVGAGGNILTTIDSGATWTAQASGTTNNLSKVYFVNATTGWALGLNGTILSTTDGGNTWNTQTSNTVSSLTGISFVSPTQGWVAGGGYILTTSNGGITWNAKLVGYAISAIYFISPTHGWAMGTSGYILSTTNGFANWKVQNSGTTYNLTGIYFADSAQGRVIGYTGSNITSLSTIDAGTTWASQTIIGNIAQLNSVNFSDSSNGWAVSSTGSILNSSSGGNTWQNQTSPSSTILNSVFSVSPTQGWAVGSGAISSNIIATNNGGTTWTGQTSPTTNQLFGVYFVNASLGWAVGAAGTILNTTNGGATWVKQTSPVLSQLTSVYFINANQGWIVGTAGIILTTTNGGASWVKQGASTTNPLLGVYFINSNQGWAVGGLNGISGTILMTINGGATWTAQTSGTTSVLNSVNFISSTQGWIVGNAGTILTTSNGGVTWTAQNSGTVNNLLGVNFQPTTQQGWAVGANGQILLYNASNVSKKPTISSFSPTFASTGTSVIIKGTAFKGTTAVSFGGVAAKSFIVINDSTINAIVGNGANGAVNVTNQGGSASLTGFNYLYYVNVTFSVDISNYLKEGNVVGKNGMRIAGNFATIGAKSLPDWTPSAIPDAMIKGANNIWSITVSIPDTSIGKSLLYKFVNNDWGQNEGVDVSNSLLNCGISDGSGNINRVLVLPFTDSSLSFCWDQCNTCNLIASLPTVITNLPSNITNSSATLSGNLTSNGGDVVKVEGIVYGTSPNPTTFNSLYQYWNSPLNGKFSYTQAGLQPNTTYYIRAFAANSIGTAYGSQFTITTLKLCPVVITNNINLSGCDSVLYNGATYKASTVRNDTIRTLSGCDSIYTIATIQVLQSTSSRIAVGICPGGSYTFNGSTYNTTGTYLAHLINAVGCDSTVTLVLTLNSPSSSTTNASICSGGTYTFNGITYATGGSYVAHLTNAAGCDSLATLILTVNATSVSTTQASFCSGSSYTFNGTTFTMAGTYVIHLINAVGCDSAATLILTSNATSSSTTSATICSGSSYYFNGSTYTIPGTYIVHLTNSVGCDSAASLLLTVKASSSSTTYASICNGNNYSFNGDIYSVSGIYTVHLTNSIGCDSAATLILTVNQSTSSTTNKRICSGSSYYFNGVYYSSTGTYTTHLANSAGCDSAATLILKVNQPTSSKIIDTICSGSSYFFNGTIYSKSGSYTIHLINSGGCDSTATLVLIVKATSSSTTNASICDGDSYSFNGNTYTTSGSYIEHLTNATGCDSAATLNLIVNTPSSSTTNASICPGGSYNFNGNTYSNAGSYVVHLTNAVGCDSAATLNLVINSQSTSATIASICPGGSYTFNGNTYTSAGSYIVHLTNVVGCDSAATLILTIKPVSTSITNVSICSGDSYTFNGSNYTTAGNYVAHLTNSIGCDSAATLVLTVKSLSISTTNASICAGGSYFFNGSNYTKAGSYISHLTNSVGCDSAATLILTVKSISTSISNLSICSGGSYTFNGTTYTKAGSYTTHLTNAVGCDSAVTLNLTVKALSTSTTSASICPGSSYIFNGTTYTKSGSYIVHLTNAVGCDSAATLNLLVKTISTSTTNASICPGGSYTFNGTSYTNAGSYVVHLINSVGCDSAATLNLTIKSASTSTLNASICAGSSYTFNGSTYTSAGSYVVHLTNSVGCDSAATLVLTVKSLSISTTNASICMGSSYFFNGSTYSTAGSYVVHLTNSVGCDSAATLILTIKDTSSSVTNASICPGGNYTFNGNTYTTAGSYVTHLTNAIGCDSAATLILTIKDTSSSVTIASICPNGSYTFNGINYTTAGTYTSHLINSIGCDSAASLILTVNNVSSSTTTASICPGGSYTFNGITYINAGRYVAHLTNSIGCDSAATLILAASSPSVSITNASICSGGSYTFNGTTYTISGSYVSHLTNAAGCDSAATLILTVKPASSSTSNASICEGSSYTFNGSSYTAAGSYVTHLTNAAGCDSAATLVLTIKPNSTSTINASICMGESYTFNGTTYSKAGSYVAHLINAVGCDSAAILILSIKATSTSILSASICAGGSYTFNGTTYTTSGTYTSHLINSIGCDSAASLVLSVNTASSSTTTKSICQGDSYTFNGVSYTTAGSYVAHLQNATGCDSVATLILTINATSSSLTNASVVQGNSYLFNGSSYSNAGTYVAHLTNALGCDSTATLVLTIIPTYTISGSIKSPLGKIIPTVTVGFNASQSVTTDVNGNYYFNIQADSSSIVKPSKNNDNFIANGVSTTDISLIQSHILKRVILNSPYKLIAADVNSDGAINSTDIAQIKSLILKHITKFAGNKLWAFVDSNYSFPTPTKSFSFRDSINIASINANQTGQNFIGVKLGDVNYDWNSAILGIGMSSTPIELFNDNITINNSSNEIRVPIKVNNFKGIMGMQYTLNFNSDVLELKSVENNKIGVDYNMDYAEEGKIPFLWVNLQSEVTTLSDSTVLFDLVFNKKGNLNNEKIAITSDITSISAFDGNYSTINVIKSGGTLSDNVIIADKLLVYPNPAKDFVTIKGSHISTVQVFDNLGKMIRHFSLNDTLNPVVQVGELGVGVYHLRIQTTNGKVFGANFIKE